MTPLDVQRARKRLGLTQVQFAEALGVTAKAVEHWEQGRRAIQRPTILLLKMLLDPRKQRRK